VELASANTAVAKLTVFGEHTAVGCVVTERTGNKLTVVAIGVDVAVVVVTQPLLTVIWHVIELPLANVVVVYVLNVAKGISTLLFFHWYAAVPLPKLLGVAVKVTDCPLQIELSASLDAIATEGVTAGVTVTVTDA